MINVQRSLYLLLFLLFNAATAQEIFDYERDISNRENYHAEEITFRVKEKKDSITLSGTLICPKTPFDKVIVIVPGSGADTRHSHYLLTQKLLEHNIAVYRYDERGLGKSQGKFNTANYTITTMGEELASCIAKLRKADVLDGKKLGLLGHSQGGMVTMEAYTNKAPLDFLIQWATPVQKHGKFLEYQLMIGQNAFNGVLNYPTREEKLETMAYMHQIVAENKELESWPLSKKLDKAAKKIGYGKEHYERFPYLTLASEKDIVRKDFEEAYRTIGIPVLYIIGSDDTFVDPVAETKLLQGFGNPNITLSFAEGLNHYLTKGKLSLQTMYDIDDTALITLFYWIDNEVI